MTVAGVVQALLGVNRFYIYSLKMPFINRVSIIKVGKSKSIQNRMNDYALSFPFGVQVFFLLIFQKDIDYKIVGKAEKEILNNLNDAMLRTTTRMRTNEWFVFQNDKDAKNRLRKEFENLKKYIKKEYNVETYLITENHIKYIDFTLNKKNIPASIRFNKEEVEKNKEARAKIQKQAEAYFNQMTPQQKKLFLYPEAFIDVSKHNAAEFRYADGKVYRVEDK